MDEIIYFLENYRDILPAIRRRLNVSGRYVCDVAGLHRTAIWHIESKKTRNSEADTLLYILLAYKKIAEQRGADISDLLKPPSQKIQRVV